MKSKMSDVFVGNSIIGNFITDYEIHNLNDYELEKKNNILYLCKIETNEENSKKNTKNKNHKIKESEKQIELKPLDDDATLVIDNFSEEIGDFNESIYKLEKNNDIIIVVLYVYSNVHKLLLDSEAINIHLRRDEEIHYLGSELCEKDVVTIKDIMEVLSETFINNKSIFINEDKKNNNTFTIYGNKYRAHILKERNGVFVIDKIFKNYNKEYTYGLTQIFGNVKFVSWDDSLTIDNLSNTKLNNVKTNDVFKAWEAYMDFEKEEYEEALRENELIKYSSVKVIGDELYFELTEPIENKYGQVDFEMFSVYDPITEDFDNELPKDYNELSEKKSKNYKRTVFLGKYTNEEDEIAALSFKIPTKSYLNRIFDCGGLLYASDQSLSIEQHRRKKVLKIIESKKNQSSNIIMKLSEGNVKDTELGTSIKPQNEEVLKKMFDNNIKGVELKPSYLEAMSIAINTPDLALIQGPPGSGKSTLIVGIIARLNQLNKNYKILVSAEQHVALTGVVNKLSGSKLIPPFITSSKFGDEEFEHDTLKENIVKFQTTFKNLCESLLRNNRYTNNKSLLLTKIIYTIKEIKNDNYNTILILQEFDELKSNIIKMDSNLYSLLANDFESLNKIIKINKVVENKNNNDPITNSLLRKIDSQRLELDVFLEDDGVIQLNSLIKFLKNINYNEFLLDESIVNILNSEDKDQIANVFDKYVEYVNNLKEKITFTDKTIFDTEEETAKDIIDRIQNKIYKNLQNNERTFSDIIENLLYRINDFDSCSEVIKKYTTVIGSTCAQADRSIDMVDITNNKYDYVIIDEAARANPIDIMIPMMLGTKVVLIGDHKQLPHYIETMTAKKFSRQQNKFREFDETLLKKSLFQILYENLENAYTDGRIKFKRTIMFDEQYRMNPTIGTFISDTFYDSKVSNAEKTINQINDYNVYDGKNVVWVNIPFDYNNPNQEKYINQSYQRECEVDKIIEILSKLINNNKKRELDIGVISYYKQQVELLRTKIKDNFTEEPFKNPIYKMCNTVDSFQGQQFDIIIISGVRCNKKIDADEALGFINHMPSRINVSLSRARRLLIMVGDKETYSKNEYFNKFIEYVEKEGKNE